jgi:hypothetical protein
VWQLKSLKEPDLLDAVDCGHRTQRKKEKEEEEESIWIYANGREIESVFLGPA